MEHDDLFPEVPVWVSVIMILLIIALLGIFLTSCVSTKPALMNSKVKSIEVFKGDRITVPFDGRLISDYTIYRLLLESERKEEK